MQDTVKPNRRAEEEKVRRRRRDDLGDGRLKNLSVEGELDPDYVYRFINDDPGRVDQCTVRDDWDPVTHDMIGNRGQRDSGVGSVVERVVDRATGKRAILVRKKKEFHLEDKAKSQARIDEMEQALRQGIQPTVAGTEGKEDFQVGATAYVPAGGIVINSQRKS